MIKYVGEDGYTDFDKFRITKPIRVVYLPEPKILAREIEEEYGLFDGGFHMASLSYFAKRMIYYCSEVSVGYDQSNRWDIRDGGETDCSALVIHCLKEAGFNTGSASYTGNMRAQLTKHGWKVLSADVPKKVGDILLRDKTGGHVAVYVSSGMVAYASIDERGKISGGKAGDQTGNETKVTSISKAGKFDCVLRYSVNESTNTDRIEEDGICGTETVRALQKYLGTEIDGIISEQWIAYEPDNPGILKSCIEWKLNPRTGGSDVIRALQNKIGIRNNDGYLGPETISRLQAYLGCKYVDGKLDKPSPTILELQKRLNERTL